MVRSVDRRGRIEASPFWTCAVAVVALIVGGSNAQAIGLVYVDADDGFVTATPNLSPLSAIDSLGSDLDNQWGYRGFGSDATIFESSINANPGAEDSPELTLTLDTSHGLTSGGSYDIFVAYWSSTGADWSIKGRLATGSQTIFNRTGPLTFLPGAVAGTGAGSALWTTPPTVTTEADRVMLLGKVGTATATGGQIQVFIDDLPTTGFAPDITPENAVNFRSWLDGVAFVEAGTPISLSATIDRDTGQLSINNATGQNVQVVSYSVTSPAGALKPGSWLSVSENYDGDDGSEFDTHLWNVTAPTMPFPSAAATLSEAEDASGGSSGGTLGAGGLNLGNTWIRTPTQDVQISLTLANASVLTIVPQYTGSEILAGDFNGAGGINVADFQTLLSNLNKTITATTRAEAYLLGDMTGDLAVNYNDFRAFKNAYEAFNGEGSFSLIAGVPEPTSLALVAIGLLAASLRRVRSGRLTARLALSLGVCIATFVGSRPACAQLTYVDADATAGTGNTTPPGAFTTTNADDNLWSLRTGFASGGTIYQSGDGDGEDAPEITTTLTGLTANSLYRVYAHFWDGSGGPPDWNIRAGFTSGSTTLFANPADAPDIGAQNAVLASTLAYTTAPTVFVEADRTMYAGLVGNSMSNASGQLPVFIDDLPSTIGVNNRTWYDGLSYEAAIVLSLRVNTTSGAVSIRNPQNTALDMDYYEIRSAAGSLNVGGWDSLDSGEGGDPVGTGWDPSPNGTSNLLSEVNLESFMSFNLNESAPLGAAFSPGSTQDLRFFYAAPGSDNLEEGFVEYVSGGLLGDYNNSGTVDAADYTVWRDSLGQNVPNGTGADGDNNGNIGSGDYTVWKNNFGLSSGSGSAAVGAAVPEPSSLLTFWLTIGCCILLRRSHPERSISDIALRGLAANLHTETPFEAANPLASNCLMRACPKSA